MPAHMRPPQAAGFVEMCRAPAIGIHRIPGHRFFFQLRRPRFGPCTSADRARHLIYPLSANLVDHRRSEPPPPRVRPSRRSCLAAPWRHADRAGLQVDRVLGLVREIVRPSFIFVMRADGASRCYGPSGASDPRARRPRRLDARRLRRVRNSICRVAAHDAPQRRVGKRCGTVRRQPSPRLRAPRAMLAAGVTPPTEDEEKARENVDIYTPKPKPSAKKPIRVARPRWHCPSTPGDTRSGTAAAAKPAHARRGCPNPVAIRSTIQGER